MELPSDTLCLNCCTTLGQFYYVPKQFNLRRIRMVAYGIEPVIPHLLVIIEHIIWKANLVCQKDTTILRTLTKSPSLN